MSVDDPERYAWANEFGPLQRNQRSGARDVPSIADQAIRAMQQLATAGKPFFWAWASSSRTCR